MGTSLLWGDEGGEYRVGGGDGEIIAEKDWKDGVGGGGDHGRDGAGGDVGRDGERKSPPILHMTRNSHV